mgnify:CR=1 FL=1
MYDKYMDTILTTVQTHVKQAMREKNKQRLSILRMIMSELQNETKNKGSDLIDPESIEILSRMVKRQKATLEAAEQSQRQDKIDECQFEISVIQEFLPKPLSEDEVDTIIDQAIQTLNASDVKQMGAVIGLVKKTVSGRYDMGEISKKIRLKLQN